MACPRSHGTMAELGQVSFQSLIIQPELLHCVPKFATEFEKTHISSLKITSWLQFIPFFILIGSDISNIVLCLLHVLFCIRKSETNTPIWGQMLTVSSQPLKPSMGRLHVFLRGLTHPWFLEPWRQLRNRWCAGGESKIGKLTSDSINSLWVIKERKIGPKTYNAWSNDWYFLHNFPLLSIVLSLLYFTETDKHSTFTLPYIFFLKRDPFFY